MNVELRPRLHWPTWDCLRYAMLLGLAQLSWFALIFGGADWWTRQHDFRVRLHFEFELAIPLVPAMSLVYLSMNALLWGAPLVLQTRQQLLAFAITLACATLIAGPFFVLLPGAQAFPVPSRESLGIWQHPFLLARAAALEYNFFPSLHIAFTTISALVYTAGAHRSLQCLISLWAVAISLSTLLMHQHYVLDVLSGVLLGWLAVQLVYRRLSPQLLRRHAVQIPLASPSNCQEPWA